MGFSSALKLSGVVRDEVSLIQFLPIDVMLCFFLFSGAEIFGIEDFGINEPQQKLVPDDQDDAVGNFNQLGK